MRSGGFLRLLGNNLRDDHESNTARRETPPQEAAQIELFLSQEDTNTYRISILRATKYILFIYRLQIDKNCPVCSGSLKASKNGEEVGYIRLCAYTVRSSNT